MIGFYNYTVYATYLGFASSVLGIILACSDQPTGAVVCLLVSGLCDMFDGRIARTRSRSTKNEKQFGIQIDSLSDLVCFGVLPAVIGFSVGMKNWLFYPAMILYTLCAMIRLAYFNVTEEERQSQTDEKRVYYDGLPVTSAALIFPIFYTLHEFLPDKWFAVLWAALLLIVAVLFISPIRVRKPGTRALIVILVCGAAEFAAVLISRYLLWS